MVKKTTFVPPIRIEISSDGTEIEFTGHSKTSGMYSYKYIKSETKKGMSVTFTEDHLIKLINNNKTLNT